jgi:Ni/Co efflux regulator RcnB
MKDAFMKKFFIVALSATILAAPMANAQEWHRRYGHDNHHVQQYPRGWGPHRGPDRAGYYHGYQGYRDHRPGYRRGRDGMWYPAAAFALGAIIGGALAQ